MRRFKRIFPFLCTLLLLGLGALLPRLTSLALDRRLERETVAYEDTAVSLSLAQDGDLFQALTLIQGETLLVRLDKGVHLAEAEAAAAATDLLRALSVDGAANADLQVTPFLIADQNDPGHSGVFWECVWWENGSDLHTRLWLDDASGLLAAFQSRLGPMYSESSSVRLFLTPDCATDVAEFCRSHYPVDTVGLETLTQDDSSGGYRLTLRRERDGKTERCVLPLSLRGPWLYFNLIPMTAF